jgi:hypothetical protein
LQKHRFFEWAEVLIVCVHKAMHGVNDMKGFWQNLSQVAQGQLFNGGYLSRESVERLSAPRTRGKKMRGKSQCKQVTWPRLAIPH